MGDNHSFTVTLSTGQQAALRKIAQQQGIQATQHGEIKAGGVILEYSIDDQYHPQDGSTQVTFTVLHKPLFVPENFVEEKIHEYLDELPVDVKVEVPHVVVGQAAVSLAPSDVAPESEEVAPESSDAVGAAEVPGAGAEVKDGTDEPEVVTEG